MIMEFIFIDMMHVQMNTPTLARLSATLTRPFVAVLDLLADAFPVGRIVPLGNATFPGRIIWAERRTARNQAFARCANGDFVEFQGFSHGTLANAKDLGNLCGRPALLDIEIIDQGNVQIFMKGLLGVGCYESIARANRGWLAKCWLHNFAVVSGIMPSYKLEPSLIAGIPHNGNATTAGAQRSIASFIRLLTRTFLSCLHLGATLVAMLFEKVTDMSRGAAERLGSLFVGRIVAGRLTRPVVVADGAFSLFSI